jgi:hypothetical protein
VRLSGYVMRSVIVTNETAAGKSLRTGSPMPRSARFELEGDDAS